MMYAHFARQFLRSVHAMGCEHRVNYSEFFREGWTFHGKGEVMDYCGTDVQQAVTVHSTILSVGLWYYLSGESLPSLTLLGSSNYGMAVFSVSIVCISSDVSTRDPGHRSLARDLEAQAAVVTTNQTLREALHTVSSSSMN